MLVILSLVILNTDWYTGLYSTDVWWGVQMHDAYKRGMPQLSPSTAFSTALEIF